MTGASSGLGEATARHLSARGAIVVLGARRVGRIQSLAEELVRDGGKALAVATDVSRHEDAKALVDAAVQTLGRVDAMINNAGLMPHSPLASEIDDWNQTIDVNIKAVLYGIAAALPYMKQQKSGKSAVLVISEGLRQEAKPYGLRTTVISPGAVATELPGSITEPDVAAFVSKFYEETTIPAESFARAVAFAISQLHEVDVNEILFRPTRQEG
jgi:NADP-dependent 3-hydroxy acid dehydrogenase YdfG